MIGWLIETGLTLSVLLLVVLALREPVARMFGAGWAYALWLVPALRLALPPLPQLTPDIDLPLAIPLAIGSAAPLPVEAGPGQWVPFMLAMWAGGAVIFLIMQWLAYREFLHQLGADARPARPPSYGGIMTLVSQAVTGPLALGLVERRIVLPLDFMRRYNSGERRLALEHELTHHRRGDIWWNMTATVVLALNWFNPIAWIAFRAFRADQELSCDASVAARATADERSDYARALVKAASRPGLIGACALNSAGALKRRLRMMRGHRVSLGRTVGGVATLALFAVGGFGVGAPDYVAAEPGATAARPVAVAAALPPAPVVLAEARIVVTEAVTTARPQKARARRARAADRTRPVRRARTAPPAPPALVAPTVALAAAPPLVALPPAPAAIVLASADAPLARRLVRIKTTHFATLTGKKIGELVVLRLAAAAPVFEIEAAAARIASEHAGGGGSVAIEAIAGLDQARAALHGMTFRAPDMWNEATEECNK